MLSSRPFKKGLIIVTTGLILLTLFVLISSGITALNRATPHTKTLGISSTPPTMPTTGSSLRSTLTLQNAVDTWSNIHPFQAFDNFITDQNAVARTYNVVYDAEWWKIASYRAINPKLVLTYYIPFRRDFGTFLNNTAIHNLAYWKAVHPDWVVYRCDRVTPAYQFSDPNIPLDFTNPAVVNWQVQTYGQPASQNGYDAIAPDNIDFGNFYHACGIYRNGHWVQLYSGVWKDPRWNSDMVGWLARMSTALHNLPHPLALIPNFGFNGTSPVDPIILKAIDSSDGMLDEAGFTSYGDGYANGIDWVQRVQLQQYIQNEHKPVYTIDAVKGFSRFNIQWALASYLMGKGHSSEIYISLPQKYGVNNWFNEYNAQIGSPTNSMYYAQRTYWRDYTHGIIIANPSSSIRYTVTLKRGVHYVDLYGNSVGSTVVMQPHSGLVLLIHP